MSDSKYESDKDFGNSFMTDVKSILGQFSLCDDFVEEDTKRNTDLIVLRMEAVRYGVRVRRHKYFLKYPDDITIRCEKPSGQETEYSKVITGFGDFFFYAFADANEEYLIKWIIGDYNVFRGWMNGQLYKYGEDAYNRRVHTVTYNNNKFLAFNEDKIHYKGKPFVVARSSDWILEDHHWFKPTES